MPLHSCLKFRLWASRAPFISHFGKYRKIVEGGSYPGGSVGNNWIEIQAVCAKWDRLYVGYMGRKLGLEDMREK